MSNSANELVIAEFIAEAQEILQRVSSVLSHIEGSEISADDIDQLYRDIHTLKGTSQLFGFNRIGMVAHTIEATLEPVRQKKMKLDPQFVDLIFEGIDLQDLVLKQSKNGVEGTVDEEIVRSIITRLISAATDRFRANYYLLNDHWCLQPLKAEAVPAIKESVIPKPLEREKTPMSKIEEASASDLLAVSNPLEASSNASGMSGGGSSAGAGSAVGASGAGGGDDQANESSSVRVQVALLDKLMNLVGEMVLVRNQVLQYSRNSDDNGYLKLTQRLDLVTSELQDNVMRTRMQPIGGVFSKFRRLVRDVSRDLGKKIDLKIHGSETELDKSLIEAVKDPLTHIVRNSCDHGIEKPAERSTAGKNETGSLALGAYQEGGHVVVEIKDDGRGINAERVAAKAIEKRIITPERAAKMTEREIQELIFEPGFSTAEQVSAVSGRGVGMDVVRTNIEKVGGTIDLQSVKGKGTTIQLRIPLTLAIVPAMIVRSGNESFAIPQVRVQELFRIDVSEDADKIKNLQGEMVFHLRGRLLSLVEVQEVLRPGTEAKKRDIYNIVILNGETGDYGLVVDEICDTADIVVKPLPNFLKKLRVFSGSTILGDGNVALILDSQGLAEEASVFAKGSEASNARGRAQVQSVGVYSDEYSDYLTFSLQSESHFCIPLTLVHRLEEFEPAAIECSGSDRLVQYRDGLLPLISLNQYLGYKMPTAKSASDPVHVIVVTKNNRFYGFEVDQIVDLVTLPTVVQPLFQEKRGIMGTVVSASKQVMTVIDPFEMLADITGVKVEKRKDQKFKKAKVLFAEDTAFFVKQVKKVLEGAGLDVVHAVNGEEALQILDRAPVGTFALVLSDIEMPKMNGFELTEQIRKKPEYDGLPVVALTTRFKESDVAKGKAVGFTKYLEKINKDELLNAINDLLGGKN